MATNDPAYPPSAPGALPYPSTDAPGALPYPPTEALPYPPTEAPGALPYPPMNTASPSHQSPGSENKAEPIENKTYTDAPPPYSPPSGGAPYPTAGAPSQMPPPQPGFAGYPTSQPMPYAPSGTVTVTTVQSGGQVMVVPGTCPTCRVGMLSENFTLLGICCAFWFFPLGLICCLAMRERRCTNCGAVFA